MTFNVINIAGNHIKNSWKKAQLHKLYIIVYIVKKLHICQKVENQDVFESGPTLD